MARYDVDDGEPSLDMAEADDTLRDYAMWRAADLPGHALVNAATEYGTKFWWRVICECGLSWCVNAISRDEAEGRWRQHLLEDAEA